jgi:hypothetical protein
MKKSRKQIQSVGGKPIEEKISDSPSYDDVVLAQIEAGELPVDPNRILDIVEASEEDPWEAMESRLESVDTKTIRHNVAQVDARAWLQASKELAVKAKSIAETATTKKELHNIDATVDAFDRELKERKINIQPCRLHCQNALRDAYMRLS